MPTPSPIIVASVGELVPKLIAAAVMPRSPSPVNTPMRALASGRMPAITLPNPASSTISATVIPMSSEATSLGLGAAACPSCPP